MEQEKQRYCSDSVVALRRGVARAEIALQGILEAIAILLTVFDELMRREVKIRSLILSESAELGPGLASY